MECFVLSFLLSCLQYCAAACNLLKHRGQRVWSEEVVTYRSPLSLSSDGFVLSLFRGVNTAFPDRFYVILLLFLICDLTF